MEQIIERCIDIVAKEIARYLRKSGRVMFGFDKRGGMFSVASGWYSKNSIYIISTWLYKALELKQRLAYSMLLQELRERGYIKCNSSSSATSVAKNPYNGYLSERVVIFQREKLNDSVERELKAMR